jgi:hypothetical protein
VERGRRNAEKAKLGIGNAERAEDRDWNGEGGIWGRRKKAKRIVPNSDFCLLTMIEGKSERAQGLKVQGRR